VLAVISDKTKSVCNNDTVSYFTSEVLYAYDYSPFGAILPQRTYVADTVCTTVIDYDTAYNDHYTLSFVINTLLAPGQTIRIGTAANSKILATYNPGYVTPFSYIAKILMNINPGGDGIEGYNSGSTVIVHFSADSLGFSCGNVVTAYSGSTSLSTVSIDCAVDSIYAVDTFTTCSSSDYRFGFNGKEKDNEVSGEGDIQDYGMRIYDNRLGRFLSVDQLTKGYPMLTPYQFASNTPIIAIDMDGLEAVHATLSSFAQKTKVTQTSTKQDDGSYLTISSVQYIDNENSITTYFIHSGIGNYGGFFANAWLYLHLDERQKTNVVASYDAVVETGIGDKFSMAIAEKDKIPGNYADISINRVGNTFRHFLGQALLTASDGQSFARFIGNIKERADREDSGIPMLSGLDNDGIADLLNNSFGRDYAIKNNIDLSTVSSSTENAANFLNGLAVHILSSIDSYSNDPAYSDIIAGKTKIFDPNSSEVKDFVSEVKKIKPSTNQDEN
jgi:RHS repeat-associated protein